MYCGLLSTNACNRVWENKFFSSPKPPGNTRHCHQKNKKNYFSTVLPLFSFYICFYFYFIFLFFFFLFMCVYFIFILSVVFFSLIIFFFSLSFISFASLLTLASLIQQLITHKRHS